jgi:hypothetical protein
MKFNPGQNTIVVRQGLSSTTYIKDDVQTQRVPEPKPIVEETPVVKKTTITSKKKK